MDEPVDVLIQRLHPDAILPTQAHPGDAGWDLYAVHDVTLAPGERALVGTGIALALPLGFAAFVHPRSGLAHKHGVTATNAPGTIDAGYRGEVKVNLINHDLEQTCTLHVGDRIAQLVIQAVPEVNWHECTSLPGSARGVGGHGSTGGVTQDMTLACRTMVESDTLHPVTKARTSRRTEQGMD